MKKMWKNRGDSGGFCEESGGADVPWGGGTWGGGMTGGCVKSDHR